MKVISCFAGLGGAELALKRAGIQADIYAYEIDKYAEAVNRYNNPNSVFLGDITKWKEHTDMIGEVDLIIGGSPCQGLSCAGKCAGLQDERSGLFYTFLEMIRYYKPKYFILENVASMSNANRDIITELMGAEPVMLNAALVSAQQRKRYFWTNIPTSDLEDKGIIVKDILESGEVDRDKTYCITATYCYAKPINLLRNERTQVFEPIRIGNTGNSTGQGNRVYSIKGKTVNINANGGGGGAKTGLYKIDLPDGDYIIRKLTPVEVERAFTIPDNYTKYGKFTDGSIKEISNTQRYKMLGNGFVIDVIVEGILKNIGQESIRVNYHTKGIYQLVVKEKEMIQLHHGDCLDILKTFKDNSIDCVITSPPYNMGLRIKGDKYIKRTETSKISTKYHNFKDDLTMDEYYDFTKKVLTELLRVSDLVFYNIQFLTGNKVALFKIIGDFAEKIKDIIIWDKVLAQPAMAENVLNSRFEVILILQNSKPYSRVFDTAVFCRGTLNNLWQIKPYKNNNKKHKAIFPKELCNTIISNFTKYGDTILDCFMGTGITGAVSKELDRNFIGIEIDEEYFTMAKERINQPTIEDFLNDK